MPFDSLPQIPDPAVRHRNDDDVAFLDGVIHLLREKKRWMRGCFHERHPRSWFRAEYDSFCLLGAARAIASLAVTCPVSLDSDMRLWRLIRADLPEYGDRAMAVGKWNDFEARDYAEVMRVLRAARARAAAGG